MNEDSHKLLLVVVDGKQYKWINVLKTNATDYLWFLLNK